MKVIVASTNLSIAVKVQEKSKVKQVCQCSGKYYIKPSKGNEFPDLQVNEKGEFSFNASEVGYRLNNGEKLHFTVVDPLVANF
nr:hypothetical protein [Staphylococcus agnetis]